MLKVKEKIMNYLKIAKTFVFSKIKEKVPIDVVHQVTTRCNLKCKYCCFPLKRSEITTDQAKKAIEEFSNLGTIFWTFTGGEAAMRDDIGELINHTKDCGIVYTRLQSNGNFWFKKRINQIKKVDSVIFSLDGSAEVNDQMRGAGTFSFVMDSIRLSRENNIDFSLSTVLTKTNLSNNFTGLRYMFDLAQEFDCKINFQPVFPTRSQHIPYEELEPIREQMQQAMELIRNFDKESGLVKFSQSTYEIWSKILNNEKVEIDCRAGKRFCFLNSNGLVLPLAGRSDEGKNGLELGFASAFENLTHDHNEWCARFCFPERTNLYNFNFETVMKYLPRILTHKSI